MMWGNLWAVEYLELFMCVCIYMDVCTQFDVLWENLSAVEHLELFGKIKNAADPCAEALRVTLSMRPEACSG